MARHRHHQPRSGRGGGNVPAAAVLFRKCLPLTRNARTSAARAMPVRIQMHQTGIFPHVNGLPCYSLQIRAVDAILTGEVIRTKEEGTKYLRSTPGGTSIRTDAPTGRGDPLPLPPPIRTTHRAADSGLPEGAGYCVPESQVSRDAPARHSAHGDPQPRERRGPRAGGDEDHRPQDPGRLRPLPADLQQATGELAGTFSSTFRISGLDANVGRV